MWVQYGVELGVAGLATIVFLCWYLVNRNRRLRKLALTNRQSPGDLADRDAVLHGHMLAMLAGLLVTGSFLSNAYYPLTYMALGMAAAALLGSPLMNQLEATSAGTAKAPSAAEAARGTSRGVTRIRRRQK
jgi:hypothetical protein